MFNRRLLAIAIIGGLGWYFWPAPEPVAQSPAPQPAPVKPPEPEPKKPKPKPWGKEAAVPVGIEKISLGGNIAPDGKTEVQVDYPLPHWIRNIGSHRDGAGMCVMSSIEMSALWAGLEQMRGLRNWCAQQPGGGYPQKVDRQLKEYCSAKSIPCPEYIQYEGPDPSILELCLKTGRLASLTYSGRDGVRYSGSIAHMVCCSHYKGEWGAILDNNGKPLELIWMSPAELVARWKGNGGGWVFVWLQHGPPPVPRN